MLDGGFEHEAEILWLRDVGRHCWLLERFLAEWKLHFKKRAWIMSLFGIKMFRSLSFLLAYGENYCMWSSKPRGSHYIFSLCSSSLRVLSCHRTFAQAIASNWSLLNVEGKGFGRNDKSHR
jgi:hypothetical protein